MSKQAFIFAWQGASQYVGMGKDLYDRLPGGIDEADEMLNFKLSTVCFDGPEEDLKRTDICQPTY